jgi:GGDEF domain-containing protein
MRSCACGIIVLRRREARSGEPQTQSPKHVEPLDRLLDGIAIVRQSDGTIVYANRAIAELLAEEPGGLQEAVAELLRGGRTNAVELAHPDFGLVRLIVVPRDAVRAAERVWRRDLRRELARAKRRRWPLTLAAIALDAGGGTQAAAAAWVKVLRDEDSLTPYEEGVYLAILPDCPAESAHGVAARIRDATPPPATVSLGFTTASGDERLDALVKRALRALEDARAAGSNQVVVTPAPTAAG